MFRTGTLDICSTSLQVCSIFCPSWICELMQVAQIYGRSWQDWNERLLFQRSLLLRGICLPNLVSLFLRFYFRFTNDDQIRNS